MFVLCVCEVQSLTPPSHMHDLQELYLLRLYPFTVAIEKV